jgi:hypothetical protein
MEMILSSYFYHKGPIIQAFTIQLMKLTLELCKELHAKIQSAYFAAMPIVPIASSVIS